ncbi:helix-turn-helix domain-containing protein [Bacillus cereus]|nr:helix-turn-helix transcriptional regulator [Bacillus cereus]HDR3914659.1 helix-turn-helix transcriptional regulator [Bacillus cereus]HDV7172687.1 helix-turn-helix transcriptional regulator [Bacillus cereus]
MQVRIKEIRKEFGDTLQSLAHKIDYDYSNLSKVERGLYTPSIELLQKIADVYQLDLTDLLCESKFNSKKEIFLEKQTITEKYFLSVDGIQVSDDELDFLIQSIRVFRENLKKYKENKINGE